MAPTLGRGAGVSAEGAARLARILRLRPARGVARVRELREIVDGALADKGFASAARRLAEGQAICRGHQSPRAHPKPDALAGRSEQAHPEDALPQQAMRRADEAVILSGWAARNAAPRSSGRWKPAPWRLAKLQNALTERSIPEFSEERRPTHANAGVWGLCNHLTQDWRPLSMGS